MRILLLTHAFNGLAQRLFVDLREGGHQVSVELVISDAVTEEAVALFDPDVVLAPFLKRAIPESVWSRRLTLVGHPGPPGDRGPSALDHAVLDGVRDWGVTVLQAAADFDAGPVWAWRPCALRPGATKGSLYRHEVTQAAALAVQAALAWVQTGSAQPLPAALPAPCSASPARCSTPMPPVRRSLPARPMPPRATHWPPGGRPCWCAARRAPRGSAMCAARAR